MRMHQRVKIFNGKIIVPGSLIARGTVLVTDGLITGIEEGDIDFPGESNSIFLFQHLWEHNFYL